MAACGRALLLVAICIGLAGIATVARSEELAPIRLPDTQYEPVDWASLEGWASDDHATAFAAFLESCRALNASHQSAEPAAITDALKAVCMRAVAAVPLEEDSARKFFEDNF